jgi:hypothetical protein
MKLPRDIDGLQLVKELAFHGHGGSESAAPWARAPRATWRGILPAARAFKLVGVFSFQF